MGRKQTEVTKEKIRQANLGKTYTEEFKRKMSEARKGKVSHYQSEESREKIRQANIGKKLSEEHKRKIKENHPKHWLNKTRPDISKDQHYNWQGGKSFEPYTIDWTLTLKRSIRERDHFLCQLCYKEQQNRLHSIHHIDYNKENCNPNNLITLCTGCNSKVNFNREYWKEYFQDKINKILNK